MLLLPITWQDGLEIVFFSSLFYYVALWLRKDRQQNLLWYFYGYYALTLSAHIVNLPTVSLFLIAFSPIVIMLFIVLHQDILQRNFVALRRLTPAKPTAHNWLEALIQTCLIVINNNKAITCIIERNDNMHTFLTVPFIIHAPLHTALLETLTNGDSYDQYKMIWIDSHGNLEGINTTWTLTDDEYEGFEQRTCLEDALLYTTKTDALILTITPDTRTFTIIMQGNQLQKVSAHHAYTTIQKYLMNKHTTKNEGDFHVTHAKNNSNQKHTA